MLGPVFFKNGAFQGCHRLAFADDVERYPLAHRALRVGHAHDRVEVRVHVDEAWREHARFWGRPLRVHTPAGAVEGVARDLDNGGGLVLRLDDGREVTVMAGDVEL